MKAKSFILLCFVASFLGCTKKENKPNYTNFKILQVSITAMPFSDSQGDQWDLLDGPDVFFNIEGATSTVLYEGSNERRKNISKSDLPLTWDFLVAHEITNPSVTQFVTVYDYDTIDPNDQVGYVGFTMNDHKNGYPKTITKTSNDVTVVIRGEWY